MHTLNQCLQSYPARDLVRHFAWRSDMLVRVHAGSQPMSTTRLAPGGTCPFLWQQADTQHPLPLPPVMNLVLSATHANYNPHISFCVLFCFLLWSTMCNTHANSSASITKVRICKRSWANFVPTNINTSSIKTLCPCILSYIRVIPPSSLGQSV